MLLFLDNKCNLPSNTKIAHNSTNINKIDILTVLQDSFIHEENNDIFNDTNNTELFGPSSPKMVFLNFLPKKGQKIFRGIANMSI